MIANHQVKPRFSVFLWWVLAVLVLPALACSSWKEEVYVPETPRQYEAVTVPIEVYVLIDQAGNVVDFDQPYTYGVNASMRYVLRFWDVGRLKGDSYEVATVHRAYTPLRITAINEEIEEDLTDEQKADIYARSSFPTTEVNWGDLSFQGGPAGYFTGTDPETGERVSGHMDWREKEWEMHIVFNAGIQQNYLVIDDEPFYNWP
jgi:hypothetical protein